MSFVLERKASGGPGAFCSFFVRDVSWIKQKNTNDIILHVGDIRMSG
ncbi:hypothetical protein BCW_0906 [Bacillus cereus W]|nr:hypothetical protein BCW_0906 [Bacillus cereus W]